MFEKLLFITGIIMICLLSDKNQGKADSDYIEYSSLIQTGEENILDQNYRKAIIYFKKAIYDFEMPLASDCFTALQLCAYLDDGSTFIKFLSRGFSVGLKPEYFKKDSLLTDYILKNNLEKTVKSKFKKFSEQYRKNIDNFLLDSVNKMTQYDNKWKVYYKDSLSHANPTSKEQYWKKYDSIVSRLVEEKLMPLIREHGYPGQRKIGIEMVQASKDYPEDYAFTNNGALFILLHYYAYPRDCSFNEILLKEVVRGNMRPEHFASVIDFQARFGKGKFCKVGYYNQWHSTDDSLKFDQINKRRSEIGLSTFQVLKRKYARGKSICKESEPGKSKRVKLFYWCG